MKKLVLFLPSLLFFSPLFTQTDNIVQLTACYTAARNHAALSAQPTLLRQQSTLRLAQMETGKKPTVALNGRATFQTENVDLGIDNPVFTSPDLPLFQYRATIDATYTIYDGGYRQALLEQEKAGLRLQEQGIEVELHKLRERVNQPFFNILLLRKKKGILENTRDELLQRIKALEGAIHAGARLPSAVERLQVQVLHLHTEIEKTQHDIRGLFRVLEALTGSTYPEDAILVFPILADAQFPAGSRCPELQLFQLQQDQTQRTEALLDARTKPRVSAFAQAGLGAPNPLNFFDDNLSPFGIIGAQFTWNILDWQQTRRDREIIQVQRQVIEVQKAYFLQQIHLLDGKFQEDLLALESSIQHKDAMIQLQKKIQQESAIQLEQGVRTPTDYLSDVNAVLQTEIQLETLRLQVQQLKIDYLTLKGLL